MKDKKIMIKSLFLVLMIIPLLSYSQSISRPTNSLSPNEESWMPINNFTMQNAIHTENSVTVAPQLTNVLNRVSFYIKNAVCNSEEVVLLKLINSNNYTVKISWQITPTSPIMFFIAPARRVSEGACSPKGNIETSELIIKKLTGSDVERKKKKEYILSSITVTQVK